MYIYVYLQRVVESLDQRDDGRLPSARRATQRNHLKRQKETKRIPVSLNARTRNVSVGLTINPHSAGGLTLPIHIYTDMAIDACAYAPSSRVSGR